GYLSYEEMPESLRNERDKWDTDRNGLIDLNEYKAYFQARMQQRAAERSGMGYSPNGMPSAMPGTDGMMPNWSSGRNSRKSTTPDTPAPEDGRKPIVVYRAGQFPKDFPPAYAQLFTQCDKDGDGQIGLYEWRASGRPLEEFHRLDRNNDGFVTIE